MLVCVRFLQANDAKAHRAMKQAEDMTKEKQQRLQRIKNLKSQISAIQSDISKHKEQKEECIKSRLLESGIITDNTARSMRGYTSIS